MNSRLFLLVFAGFFSPVLLLARESSSYRRNNLTATEGEKITIPLKLQSARDRWETRLITQDILKVISRTNLPGRLEIVLEAVDPGMGRLEAVLIRENNVIVRVYYFIKVERRKKKPSGTGTDGNAGATGQDDSKKKEVPGEKEFTIARNMFEQGFYEESARYFRLFRRQYPKSPLVDRARVYEGQALFSAKKYRQALTALGSVGAGAEPTVRQLAALWEGHTRDALNQDSEAVAAYLKALVPGGDPEVTIRARTGLALHYARKGKYRLARLQFRLLFATGGKDRRNEKNSGYVLALYYAARMYDRTPVIRDIDRAYDYYRRFLKAVTALIDGLKDPAKKTFFRRLRKDALERRAFLKSNFIDFR